MGQKLYLWSSMPEEQLTWTGLHKIIYFNHHGQILRVRQTYIPLASMDITVHETLKLQLSTQDALKMLGGLWSGEPSVPGRDFTLCRQFYTARKLTPSHGIMSKVEIDFKILEILLLRWKLMYEILDHLYYCFCLFVCFFVCLFLLSNQGNNEIFPKQT